MDPNFGASLPEVSSRPLLNGTKPDVDLYTGKPLSLASVGNGATFDIGNSNGSSNGISNGISSQYVNGMNSGVLPSPGLAATDVNLNSGRPEAFAVGNPENFDLDLRTGLPQVEGNGAALASVDRSIYTGQPVLPADLMGPATGGSSAAEEELLDRKKPPNFRRISSQLRNGFHLEVRDLLIWTEPSSGICGKQKMEPKMIIKGISTEFKPGTMTALIGPSGCGKTTILNYLAGRMNESQSFKTYSEYYLNSAKVKNLNEFKNIIGYVLQEDLMEPELTPRQTFEFYATLRGHPNPKETAEEIIDNLDLHRASDTIVGNEFKRGVSGGEKKRVNIGIELVSNPNLLFLDEPTTGLDSITAFEIINQLFKLKKQGMTIVTVLHAPSNEILALFDKVVVMVAGELVFDGPPDQIAQRLSYFNFELPQFENPIEYYMKIIDKDDIKIEMTRQKGNADEDEVAKVHSERITSFVAFQKEATLANIERSNQRTNRHSIEELRKISSEKNQPRNFLTQTFILTKMFGYLFFKNFLDLLVKIVLIWALNIIILLQYVDSRDQDLSTTIGRMDKSGLLFMALTSFFFSGSNALTTLFLDRKRIYLKDKNTRLYSPFAFYVSNQIYQIPFYLANISLIVLIFYFGLNFNRDDSVNYAWFLYFFFVGGYMGGGSMGLSVSIIVDTIQQASTLNPVINLPIVITSGFFAKVKEINEPLRALSNLSVIRFALQGTILTQFGDHYGDKPENSFFDFTPGVKWLNLIIVLLLMFGFRIIFFFFFLFKYRELDAKNSENPVVLQKYLGHDARVSKPNAISGVVDDAWCKKKPKETFPPVENMPLVQGSQVSVSQVVTYQPLNVQST